jgi:flavin reductase (DIM6/NTAB) family NADH-FMN oxidoreductase RutF
MQEIPMSELVTVEITPTDVLGMLPPYPIVLVTTQTNVITVNQVAYFTFSPLRIGVAIARNHYTHELLIDEQEFVVNVPTANLVEIVKQCGRLTGRDGNKFERVGLTPAPGTAVNAVRIAECSAFIECRVQQKLEFENRTWFIGKVIAASMQSSHKGVNALMCGRRDYQLPGEIVAPRQ